MPSAPLHPCASAGCAALLARGTTRCVQHARMPWGSVQLPERIRGRKLQRLRDQLFTKHPLCVVCQAKGRTAIATIRDHVIPLAEGGRDDHTNEQALCQTCSDTKTQAESLRGRVRGN